MDELIHILHLEDDPVDSELLVELLRDEGLNVQLDCVHTLAGFRRALDQRRLDMIFSDYTVPGMNVLEALNLAHTLRPEVPYIFVSGTIGEDLAIECLKRGATDYVLKTNLSRLGPSVRRALREAGEQARRKQGEEELARSTARFNAVISSAMDAIISIDDTQKIVLFNPAAETMFRVPAAEALGQSINRFIPARFRAAHTRDVERFGQTGISSRAIGHLGSVRGLRANGEEFPIEASISQVNVRGEKLYTVILRDITERLRSEEALKQARDQLARANADLELEVQKRTAQLREANASLQHFAYSAAHDLRAPLRAIRNFSAILVEDYAADLSEDPKSLLGRITGAADQMKELLDDLLEYSRVSAAESDLKPVSLKTAVSDALKFLEADVHARNATVSVTDPLPPVIGHHATLVMIIQNLLSNALKFVPADRPPSVRIWAETRSAPAAESFASAVPSARPPPIQPVVRLWMEDNGIGIAPEDLGKIFGVFQRLHGKHEYSGTGLGLAICRKGAERMKGQVGVESEPGKGSRFWLDLPRANAP